jgi:multidrug efflux pump subunit AcrA (membrane-fusion protein)
MLKKFMSVLVMAILIGFAGAYAYLELMPENDNNSKEGPIFSTEAVTKGDIKVGVETVGSLNPSRNGSIQVPGDRYSASKYSYILKEIIAEEGDEVKKGDPLITLASTDIEKAIEKNRDDIELIQESLMDLTGLSMGKIENLNPRNGITINAPIQGRVIDLDLETGDSIKESQVIAQIIDDSNFIVEGTLSVSEASKFEVGSKVKLAFPYFSGELEGEVSSISSNNMPSNEGDEYGKGFVYKCEIIAENPGLIQKGMTVSIGYEDESTGQIYYAKNDGEVVEFLDQENVLGTTDAIVTKVHVNDMEFVEKGSPIITMSGEDTRELIEDKLEELTELKREISDLETKKNEMTLTATMDGVVAQYYSEIGDTLETGDWIGRVYNTNDMMLWSQIDDIDILNVKKDAAVKITVDAIPGKTYEGIVEHVSTSGNSESGLTKFDVSIKVEGGPRLRPGMQANAYIEGGEAKDVLIVPIEGVFEEEGKTMVEILGENGLPKAKAIEVGLMNNRYAEVKEGLSLGDEIITGSSSDMLPSEHIDSEDTILPDNGGNKDEE